MEEANGGDVGETKADVVVDQFRFDGPIYHREDGTARVTEKIEEVEAERADLLRFVGDAAEEHHQSSEREGGEQELEEDEGEGAVGKYFEPENEAEEA